MKVAVSGLSYVAPKALVLAAGARLTLALVDLDEGS